MIATLGCMKDYLTRVIFAGVLGLTLWGAALTVSPAAWADEIKADAVSPESPVPNATYDESQPGANDPRVKEGFAAYKAGDFKKAYEIWLPLAEAGNAEAQFRVARLYWYGEGVDFDDQLSLRLYRQASNQAHIFATYNLALKYQFGHGVEISLKKAAELYRLAAEIGDVPSQNNLGLLLIAGEGIERNYVDGLMWLMIAAEKDSESKRTLKNLINYIPAEHFTTANKRKREWLVNHPR